MTTTAPDSDLHRRIGLLAASMSGIGIVLGAGIYVLVGEAAGIAGNGVWLAFVVGAFLAAATGLSYAELTAMFPEAGAAAVYAREAFGRRTGFVTGWVDVAINAIAAPAVALGFGGYLADMTGLDRTWLAVAAIVAACAIALAGVSETIGLASAFALVEGVGLLIVIAVGLPSLDGFDPLSIEGGLAGLLGGAALVFFAYEGFEEIATLSEEVKDPTRNIPRALIAAIVVTTVLYVAVSAIAVAVVRWDVLAASDAPLALVVETASSDRLADALSVIALFATFNTVLLVLATGPRAMYGMARRRLLPPVFGRVWAARGTPWVAILAATTVSLGFAATGDIGFVAQVTNFGVFVLFIVVNGAVIALRLRQPSRPRPFRLVPQVGGVPVVPVVGIAGALLLAYHMDRDAFVAGSVTVLLGVALSVPVLRSSGDEDAALP